MRDDSFLRKKKKTGESASEAQQAERRRKIRSGDLEPDSNPKGESKDLRADYYFFFFFSQKIMPYVRFDDVGSAAHTACARVDGWRVNLVQFMDELSEKKVLQLLQTKCKSAVGPKSLRFVTFPF